MKFNAGVSLSDEEVRHPTEAGRETYPMKWVDTHKKRIYDETTTMFLPAMPFPFCFLFVYSEL